MFLTIYTVTVVIWALFMILFAFSTISQNVSDRVLNSLIILTVIPGINTLFLIVGIISAIIDKRTREERAKEFIEKCKDLDTLLQAMMNKFKNNG